MGLSKRVSGTKTVIVPIEKVGRNPFPYVEDLRDRYIKYIDFCGVSSLPYSSSTPVTDSSKYLLSLADRNGNTYNIQDVPLEKFDLTLNWGIRPAIMRRLSLQDSHLICTDAGEVGKFAVFVFYYDEPLYAARNTTTDVAVNAFEVSIVKAVQPNSFPDNRTMVDKRFRAVFFTPVATTPTYKTGFTFAESKDLYISLYKGNYAIIDTLPLMCLYAVNMVEPLEFANIQFDFTNSYILVGGDGANTQYIGRSLLLNAAYENK